MALPPQAVDLEDRIGVTMRFIRATEKGYASDISSCLLRYPTLKDLVVNPYSFTGNLSRHLLKVKDHVVQLARDHALDELGKSHADLVGSDGLRAQQTRQKNTRLIFRTCPGRSCNIGAVQNKNGEVVVEPSAMAATLREHWGTNFSTSKVNTDLLYRWLEDFNLKEVNEKAPFHDGVLVFKKPRTSGHPEFQQVRTRSRRHTFSGLASRE